MDATPLRYACLPRGDSDIFFLAPRSYVKKSIIVPFFPEGQELLSLPDDNGVSKAEIYSQKALFFGHLIYRIMIAETTRY